MSARLLANGELLFSINSEGVEFSEVLKLVGMIMDNNMLTILEQDTQIQVVPDGKGVHISV